MCVESHSLKTTGDTTLQNKQVDRCFLLVKPIQ